MAFSASVSGSGAGSAEDGEGLDGASSLGLGRAAFGGLGVSCFAAFFGGECTALGSGVGSVLLGALALDLPPIIPSFLGCFAVLVGVEGGVASRALVSPGVGSAGAGVSFFLPPITPKPPRDFFCISRGWGGGVAGFCGGDTMGVRLRRDADSASGSDSVAVASSASAVDACGDGTASLIFGLVPCLLN